MVIVHISTIDDVSANDAVVVAGRIRLSHVVKHSRIVKKLLELPWQPPYMNGSHLSEAELKAYLDIAASHGPIKKHYGVGVNILCTAIHLQTISN